MRLIGPMRMEAFLKSAANSALGIIFEIVLVAVFISAGFVVCMFWWGLFG